MRIIIEICLSVLLLVLPLFAEPYWVFFIDKGFERSSHDETTALECARNRLSSRCLNRRVGSMSDGNIVGFEDIDVRSEYLNALRDNRVKIRVVSRWFNAASVDIEPKTIERLSELPFISGIAPVARFKRFRPLDYSEITIEDWHYGPSLLQNKMLGTPTVHSVGINGEGVLICITDTGFMLEHQAFDSLEVLGAYDFVSDDDEVGYEPGDPFESETHGTKTWSIIGGFYPGQLVGTAYRAQFLLARTEHYTMEDPVEEDYWIAAAEWADSAGADIISMSLGYYDWYTPDSMTGDIARISIAADRMAELGICVVVCAGNNGWLGPTSMSAPADADSVITIGAVDYTGNRLSFSGQGPTADGRIKPDVVALGTGVRAASSSSSTSYSSMSGTSASTPLVAGVAALLLQARPTLLPMDVRRALTETASNCPVPNNQIGWGIPDISGALSYPIGGKLALPVLEGWNLLALPLSTTTPIDSVFGGRTGDVYHWNPDSGAYETVDFVDPGAAYFVLYDKDTLLYAHGDSLASVDIPVEPGWHAVGGPSRRSFIEQVVLSSSAGLSSGFYIYDTRTGGYIETASLSPGRGAFILVTAAGTINFTD